MLCDESIEKLLRANFRAVAPLIDMAASCRAPFLRGAIRFARDDCGNWRAIRKQDASFPNNDFRGIVSD